MINRISFRCSEDVKPKLSTAATRISEERRPFPYEVGEATNIVTDERYVSIQPVEVGEVTKAKAVELVNLIHEEAGKPNLDAFFWTGGDGLGVISL